MSSVIEFINHYQRSIDKSLNDEQRLLHCIGKLCKLAVTVQHLQETGIGRTVNSLRKIDGEVGIAAKTLVTKWKAMVAAEESEDGGDNLNNHDDNNRLNSDKDDDDNQHHSQNKSHDKSRSNPEKHRHKSSTSSINISHSTSSTTSSSSSSSKHKSSSSSNHISHHHKTNDEKKLIKHEKTLDASHKDLQTHHNKNTSVNSQNNHNSSSNNINSSKRKLNKLSDDEELTIKSPASSSDRHKIRKTEESHHSNGKSDHHRSSSSSKSDSKNVIVSSSSSSSKNSKSSSSSKSKHKDKHRSESDHVKREAHSSKTVSSSTSSSSSTHKKDKVNGTGKIKKHTDEDEDEENEEGIDYSMGASFDDALQMMSMPSTSKGSSTKKSKESTSHKQDFIKLEKKNTPALLTPAIKLEPLPDITSEIVAITNNYKPMPLNPLVMDCVYPQNGRQPKRQMTDEEALGASISSKNLRTKVYSGVKTGAKLNVPSLFDLSIRVLQENIDSIEYTGGVPFDILKPILDRASPEQLFTLEHFNPYLVDESDFLWEHHCKRKFRGYNRQEMETWREMFMRCQDEQEAKLKSLTANIRQSQVQSVPVKQTKLAYVDSAVKPPRNIQKKQIQYGTDRKVIVSPAARVASLNGMTNNLAPVGDARLRVAAGARDTAQAAVHMRSRKAPLMQKTLAFIKGRFKR